MSMLGKYLRLVDVLRESRRSEEWKPENDRPLLARLEDLYSALAEDEQSQVESQGWRAWPEDYDAQRTSCGFHEILFDAAEDGSVRALPRTPKAA